MKLKFNFHQASSSVCAFITASKVSCTSDVQFAFLVVLALYLLLATQYCLIQTNSRGTVPMKYGQFLGQFIHQGAVLAKSDCAAIEFQGNPTIFLADVGLSGLYNIDGGLEISAVGVHLYPITELVR